MSNSYAEVLFGRLKNKNVEVYSGDTGTTRQYSQDTVTMKEVIRGLFVEAVGDAIMLEVSDNSNTTTNIVYINAWNVKTIVELKNGLSVTDIYNGEHVKVKK